MAKSERGKPAVVATAKDDWGGCGVGLSFRVWQPIHTETGLAG